MSSHTNRFAEDHTARTAWSHTQPPLLVHTLHPGDVALATRGETLETLLGSCVSVILTDPRRTVGAMCHIVHTPRPGHSSHDSPAHGHAALKAMDRLLIGQGIQPHLCEAYVFGGGNMFPQVVRDRHVGETNAGWVLEALASRGTRVLQVDQGGTCYRRVRWMVGPGEPQVHSVTV